MLPSPWRRWQPQADGTSYRFFLATNQLGDVIGLYNANGTLAVKYEYDAWGNILSTTDADGDALNSLSQEWSDINPFRYRGYYWDAETGLYYLQSRYYDAEMGRFINQDSYVSTGTGLLGYNMFAYCDNNPVNGWDPTGALFEKGAGGAGYGGFYAPCYGGGGGSSTSSYSAYAYANAAVGALAVGTVLTTTVALDGLRREVIYINQTRVRAEEKEREKEAVLTPNNNQGDANKFPEDPYQFNPKGLLMNEYLGSDNGRIIKWKDPITGIAVFEWDEDFNHGPHYHVMKIEWDGKHIGPHLHAGDKVPEPWATMYF